MPGTQLDAVNHAPSVPLYRQLRPRPHGPSAEEVVGHQRARIFGATIAAVGARGYAATSVAELGRLAGVSKRTFYEQFANKEACLLATYDAITDCALSRVAAARDAGRDAEAGLRGAVEAFVLAAAEHPAAARLALVEMLVAGPVALAHARAGRRRFEGLLAGAFARTATGVPAPAIVCGIACGVEGVVRQGLLGEVPGELAALAGELAQWALAHCSPALAELSDSAPAQGERAARWPRVRARASTSVRLMRAAAELAAGEGYARLSQGRIAGRAGVSGRELEDRYESAEACYLAAIDLAGMEALASADAASRTAGDGPRGACRAIAALLEHIAADPVLRGVVMLDLVPDGAAAVARREAMLRRFVGLLAGRLPASPRAPGVIAEATVAAVWGTIARYVSGDAAHLLPALAGQAAYVALAPIVGAEVAVRAILAEERALLVAGVVDGSAV